MKVVVIRNATIIDPQSALNGQQADLLIEDGRIEKIGPDITNTLAQQIEAPGLCVAPGWMDIGTQIGDPGFEHREDIRSASTAACLGGYTALAAFPNTEPTMDTKAALNYWSRQSKDDLIDLFPIGALTRHCQGKEITEMIDMQRTGALAFSDGEHAVQNNGVCLRALQYVKAFNGIIINRAHDAALAGEGQLHEGGVSTTLGIKGLARLAEEMMVIRDIKLAEYCDSRIHIFGVSSSRSVDIVRAAKGRGVKVTCSVPVLNLIYTDEVLEEFDPMYKVLPPLREREDITALHQGLSDGTIDCIVSNHVPLEEEQKKLEFAYAGFGTIGLQTTYSLIQTHLSALFSLDQIVRWMAINPRKILDLPPVSIQEDAPANLVLFQPKEEWVFDQRSSRSKSRNSPHWKQSLKGKVLGVFNNNQMMLTDKSS